MNETKPIKKDETGLPDVASTAWLGLAGQLFRKAADGTLEEKDRLRAGRMADQTQKHLEKVFPARG
jgi:hypothetical protein